ncbi:DUF6331 family protein [Cupriavidus basilensis]|uniref:Uncharacterized protein n=1 Tax=Cupriavidus basilensis TaxID=68895 RepID=A0A7M2H361_9BURK|nr:DUF6331 family protein [Cupriavidus basilensis]QOT79288.1 hypothetical protein F7R26_031610 [Cupriavidus basilensis]
MPRQSSSSWILASNRREGDSPCGVALLFIGIAPDLAVLPACLHCRLAPILPLLHWLETECVADCCGIDAYGFWPDAIARAAMQAGLPDLAERIAQVRERVAGAGGDVFLSHRMNNYFDRQVLLQLIDHIAACLASGARDREPY